MKSKKASALLISLIMIASIGFLFSVGYLIANTSQNNDSIEENQDSNDYLAQLTEQSQKSENYIPSASFSSSTSSSEDDNTKPAQIDDLVVKDKGTTWIFWDWTNPDDDDFDKNLIYLDGVKIATTGSSYYNATGLSPGVSYTIEIKTKDSNGNINDDEVSDTATTLSSGTTPGPSNSLTSIDNLAVNQRNLANITWTWTNPTNPFFTENRISLNGINVLNSTAQSYTALGLTQNTVYTLSIITNLNNTAMTSTTSTCYMVEWFGNYLVCP